MMTGVTVIVGEGRGTRRTFLGSGCNIAVAQLVIPRDAHLVCVAVVADVPWDLPQTQGKGEENGRQLDT